MLNYKSVIIGILLLAVVTADLQMEVTPKTIDVEQGKVADFIFTVGNFLNARDENVTITVDSTIPDYVMVSNESFPLARAREFEFHVFVITKNLESGLYWITVTANNKVSQDVAIKVNEGVPPMRFNTVYKEVTVVQGESQEFKFVVRNEGTKELKNIIIEGDIGVQLAPQYPRAFDLGALESKEVTVKIVVPEDYPADQYDFTVKAGAGNIIVTDEFQLNVVEKAPLAGRLNSEILLPWEPVKEDGRIIGYKLTMRVENKGSTDVNNVRFVFEGMPFDWTATGDDNFNVRGFETKDIEIEILPTNFDEMSLNVSLYKNDEQITKETVTFAGYKVGAPTGSFLFGGSVTVGLLIVVIIVLGLMYFRQRNKHSDALEEVKTRKYLENLITKEKGKKK